MTTKGTDTRRLRERLDQESGIALQSSTTSLQSSKSAPLQQRQLLNNARTDVIATIETLPDSTVKYLFRVVYVSIVFALLALMTLMILKLSYPERLRTNSVLIWNTAIASCGIVVLTICLCCYLKRIFLLRAKKMKWSDRRRKGAIVFSIEMVAQLLNLCFYLAPNLYLLLNECGLMDMFIVWTGLGRMTCWNTLFFLFLIMSNNFSFARKQSDKSSVRRFDASIFDLPSSYHAPKLILWVSAEVLFLSIALYLQTHQDYDETAPRPCIKNEFDCSADSFVSDLTFGIAAVFLVYFFGTIVYFRRGFSDLREKNYLNYRMSNIMIRLQTRLQMIAHCFHICSMALLWFVERDTCASFVLSWLGFLPSQFAMTVVVCVKCYLLIPLKPTKEDFTLQMWLREYSWSEEELPSLVTKRGNGCCTTAEPMFCFERAIKTFYWSAFIYDFKEVLDSQLTLKTAMHLYDLTEYELFHEPLHDTKLLVAWNSKMALLAFRGTSSLKNLFADLQITRIPHPPVRGSFWAQPMVHRGFLQTWHSNGLNHRVLELLQTIKNDRDDFSFVLTGHSLGGAVATLAAYDIRVHLQVPPCYIDCYTFGAPRVGNYAFAHDYNCLVPNTWNIINDQDYITRTMKFVVLYKRPGQRVIVNSEGDMLVRPSFIEMSLARRTGVVNLHDHFLGSYQKAFIAIARLQFSDDSIDGGFDGMLKISNTLRNVLGVSRARLIQEHNWGERIKALEKKKKREQSKILDLLSSLQELWTELVEYLSQRVAAMKACVVRLLAASQMQGIDPETRLCGAKMSGMVALDLKEDNGLWHEAGHVSLASQRTESERTFHTALEAHSETPNVEDMV